MFEALVVLFVLSLVFGVGAALVKVAVALFVLPFKLLAGLLGGVVSLVLAGPLLLAGLALFVAIVPLGLVLLALVMPLLLVGALVVGLLGL